MRELLGRLLSIGAPEGDDEDTTLRKVILLVAALTIAALAVLWGVLYWLAGESAAAMVPWAYTVISVAGVPLVGWLLVRVFAGGREGALASVRSMVRRYLPPDLVTALRADPHRLDLGGQVADVTILFADLGGYSTYAESRAPADVVALLNRYFAAAIPAILEYGGTPIQLPGDAVFAVFGAPSPVGDHAARACRAAQAILERTADLADPPIDGPQFSIGLNSGPALVGNIGSDEYRNFTAIGDTTNVAARLQGKAGAGEVVIGPETARQLAGAFDLAPLGAISVKGRSQPVEAFAIRIGRRALPR